jgi:uroporphyrinogen III methyltransferase/synthase
VVVTRARAQSSDLATRLECLGALVVEAPVIAVRSRTEDLTRDERVSSRWDWIVFTSANGVDSFFDALREVRRDARSLTDTKVAAVGGATASALAARGIIADFVPHAAPARPSPPDRPRLRRSHPPPRLPPHR